jgi:hypothetical protein
MARNTSTLASLAAACLFLLAFFPILVAALQVTPNSPCSAVCLDAPDLDESDPESSNTFPEDITCRDGDFATKPAGQKFQRCLTCLQDSSHAVGHESDQKWFFYNLRFAFDYCVLGFPNATDIESSPCVTSEACGRIEDALKDGILEPAHAQPYGYCDVDDGAMMSAPVVENCLACVRASSSSYYISNFLTAIQAGCEQQPAAGITVGLSDTVFTSQPITIVLPKSSTSDDSSNSTALSTPVIAGIAIGAAVAFLLAAGCIYMQIRKRKNRAARAAHRASPLSFRCQTHLTPRTPNFPDGVEEEKKEEVIGEKHFIDPAAALGSNPVDGSRWHSPDSVAYSSAQAARAGLSSVTTAIPRPPAPAVVTHQQSYSSSSPRLQSPDDQHHRTPTSTTSNAPLLPSFRPYVPAEYTNHSPFPVPGIAVSTPEETSSPYMAQQQQQRNSPQIGSAGGFSQRSTPRLGQRGWQDRPSQQQSSWEPQTLSVSERDARDLTRNQRPGGGSPVSVTTIQTSFPPPPRR